MKFTQHFSAQRLIKQLLDWLQTSKEESIEERVTDNTEDGVVENLLNNMGIIGKDVDASLTSFFHIKVDTGVAYKSGERILIDNSAITYDATNVSDTTDDGLSNLIPTPHSTGSKNIPVTAGFTNYVWIAYLQTTDETQFTLHKITQAKQFYKRVDGYEIIVNTSGTNPDTARFIKVGEVNCTGINTAITSNISLVNRDKYRTRLRRVQIETNNLSKTDRPATYGLGQQKLFLDDHIKSVGSGTVSPFNAHGLTLGDLGVEPNQTVEIHRQLEHMSTIIGGTALVPMPTTSSMYCLRIVVGLGDDYIVVKALALGEYIIVNGTAYDSAHFNVDFNVTFTGDPADTYQIVWNSTTQLIEKIQGNSPITDPTKFWLATLVWDGAGDIVSVPLDRRRLGGRPNELQRWVTAGRPNDPMPGQMGYNIDTNTPEYYNGVSWVGL